MISLENLRCYILLKYLIEKFLFLIVCFKSEDVTYTRHEEFEGSFTPRNCVLRRNSASGTSTGLEVFVKRFDSRQHLVNYTSIVGESGVTVCIIVMYYYLYKNILKPIIY